MKERIWVALLLASLWPPAGIPDAAAPRVRPAAVAGSWYPGDPAELATLVDGLLKGGAPTGGRVRALIAPHAGYVYSGATAGEVYRRVRGASYKRVLVLGPAHRGWFRGLSIADVDAYETPLGTIPLDAAAARLRGSPLVSADPVAHREEHGIEMHLPLLQRALSPGWTLVPVLVGELQGDDARDAAALLAPLADADTLLVVSSDFTHYGPRFGYLPFPLDGDTPARIEALDRGALKAILAGDAEAFDAYQVSTGITVCGHRPISILLRMLPPSLAAAETGYATSGALTGDYRHSVSYLGVVFTEASSPRASGLSPEDLAYLHALAAATVEAGVGTADPPPREGPQTLLRQMPGRVRDHAGAFVTLRSGGELRGCVGYYPPIVPLYQAVVENAAGAALRDRRFPPVRTEELSDLQLEVSVLTPPRPIDSPEAFRPGEQGVVLSQDGRDAVFLPEVADELGRDRDLMLTRLALKAGLPGDAWRNGARLRVFTSRKYAAPLAHR